MSATSLSTAHLDYLFGGSLDLTGAAPDTRIAALAGSPQLARVSAIGRFTKTPSQPLEPDGRPEPPRPLTADLLSGLHAYKIPLAFLVRGSPDGVAVYLGTWPSAGASDRAQTSVENNQQVLYALLRALYPVAEVCAAEAQLPRFECAGVALGIPTAAPRDPLDGTLALDRLIRALPGLSWAYLVLAVPVDEATVVGLRHAMINEMRAAEAAAQAALAPSPLAQHYTELLQLLLKTLTVGQATGAWQTGIYLLGDAESYPRLVGTWRAIFSGDDSLPEPLRVWNNPAVSALACDWALPDAAGPPGPGLYRRPFLWQTLLTSRQLASCVHLPERETSGFAVNLVPSFDVVPRAVRGGKSVSLGTIIQRAEPTQVEYSHALKDLKRHAFIAGVTGAGKTNTIVHLLRQVAAQGIPFLVIEPAKAEYRTLLNTPELSSRLRVFTLGDETISPFRLNPFEVLPGISIGVHLDLIRSAFATSFGMWTPLPQVLERCLLEIYLDRGWDIATNSNYRLEEASGPAHAVAFPTLSDLVAKVDVVTRELGYEERVTADLRAALRTRLNSLRSGGKGRMLDVQRSFPIKTLLEQLTVLELQGMGDDDDKAFMMALLLIRLAEYRRTVGERSDLQHLLVVEEAHRLLANVAPRGREEEADPRRKAVDTFTNLLSEVRAYGQGVIIADQVPVRLAPDVIKNTHLKVAHRIVDRDDREILGGAMAMDEQQTDALAVLRVGHAAVFGEGDDAPILVQVPLAPAAPEQAYPDDRRIAEHMAAARAEEGLKDLWLPFPVCASACGATGPACEAARSIVEEPNFQRTFARVVLSTLEDPDALDRMWPDLLTSVLGRRPPGAAAGELLRCVAVRAPQWYAHHRGAQAGWTYTQVERLAEMLSPVLLAKLGDVSLDVSRGAFRDYVRGLFAREEERPFPACPIICPDAPACRYRYPAADLIAAGFRADDWHIADTNDRRSGEGRRQETWEECLEAGYEMIEWNELEWDEELQESVSAAVRRASLCFGQQMLAGDPLKTPRTVRKTMLKLLDEANR